MVFVGFYKKLIYDIQDLRVVVGSNKEEEKSSFLGCKVYIMF